MEAAENLDSVALYLRQINQIPRLSEKETKELLIESRQGDQDARKKLVEANLRLVVSVAKRYAKGRLDFLDLIQEGNKGLIKAIERFNLEKGKKISTYAVWWIEQAIRRFINNEGNSIRVPVYKMTLWKLYQRTINQLRQDLGREPSFKELSEAAIQALIERKSYNRAWKLQQELGRKPTNQEISESLGPERKIAEQQLNPKEIKELKTISFCINVASLNQTPKDSDDSELLDVISDSPLELQRILTTKSFEEAIDQRFLQESLRQTLREELSKEENEVICLRFGLGEEYPRTLKETGKILGNRSKQRMQQIQDTAIEKLKNSKKLSQLQQVQV
jgi:RNA polymerase primary sigma factor